MAIKAQAPIVPVAITGGTRGDEAGQPLVYPAEITIKVGRADRDGGVVAR